MARRIPRAHAVTDVPTRLGRETWVRPSAFAQAANSPVLLVQGTNDDTIPADLTQYLRSQLCAFDQPVEMTEYVGADHIDVLPASQEDVIDHISARFKKEPAPSNR